MLNDLPCGTQVYLVTGYILQPLCRVSSGLIHFVKDCSCFVVVGVTVSKDFSGKETDSCFFTSGLITADSNGPETKRKRSF